MEKARTESKKGLWTDEEDKILREHIKVHGKGKWNGVAQLTGLKRSGKSCRLRWINYLSPTVKRGHFSEQEDDLIIRLHKLLGNRWSLIAGRVPGRTDNQVKNYWNSHLSKKLVIRRENNSRVRVSSPPSQVALPIKEKEHLDNPSTESPSKPPFNDINNGGSDDQKASEDGSLGAVEDSSMEELRRSEDNDSSFRFFSDYYMSQDFPNLMEFLDGVFF